MASVDINRFTKKRTYFAALSLLITALVLSVSACNTTPKDHSRVNKVEASKQYLNGKFHNADAQAEQGLSKMWAATKDFMFNKSEFAVPKIPLPISPITPDHFNLNNKNTLRFSRLGHSSLMIQISGKIILTDPVFSERTSPVQWAGPKRFHPVPVKVEELPEIAAEVISHNHYDHLDQDSIQILNTKVKQFLVPLGVAQALIDWGIPKDKIIELDWWDTIKIDDIEFIATPSQHFSGRGLFDRNESLWVSWVVRNAQHSLYFSGDTGYFSGFKTIGEKYGPFDYAFIECGAYNQVWQDIHMMPEETIQAFKDIKADALVPVHNGTFDLSTHAWFDPFVQIKQLAQKHNITLLTPLMGDVIDKQKDVNNYAWWEPYLSEQGKLTLKQNKQNQADTLSQNKLTDHH